MEAFARWLARKLIEGHDNVGSLRVRSQYGALEGWTSIVINTILFGIKLSLGLAVNSVALISDAIHTFADSGTSVVVIVGLRMARKPSDNEHPFGHGRMESVAALIVSILLFVASLELLEQAIRHIVSPTASSASVGVVLIVSLTIVVKEVMARFSFALADIIDSETLRADALHHRSDVYATALVVVALIASRFGYTRVDGIMGLLVALLIAHAAYTIAKEAVTPLLGQAPSRETLKNIESLARTQDGVIGVHDIIYHKYGHTSVISLHVEVADSEPVMRIHAITEAVEEAIAKKFGGSVVTHADPLNRSHPLYDNVTTTLEEILANDNRISSFHELRIVGCEVGPCKAIFDIALVSEADDQEEYDIVTSLQQNLSDRFPGMKSAVNVEPAYAYTL